MINRILVPTNFSTKADFTLEYALSLAEKLQADVHILYVINLPYPSGYFEAVSYLTERGELERNARAHFDRIRESVEGRAVTVHYSTTTGEVSRKIRSYSLCEMVDIVMIGKREMMARLVESEAAPVIKGSNIPVVLVSSDECLPDLDNMVYASDPMNRSAQLCRA